MLPSRELRLPGPAHVRLCHSQQGGLAARLPSTLPYIACNKLLFHPAKRRSSCHKRPCQLGWKRSKVSRIKHSGSDQIKAKLYVQVVQNWKTGKRVPRGNALPVAKHKLQLLQHWTQCPTVWIAICGLTLLACSSLSVEAKSESRNLRLCAEPILANGRVCLQAGAALVTGK